MFNLHDFVLDTILKMVGNIPDYQVQKYALGWYEKEVINDEDMVLISEKIEPTVEEIIDSVVEEGVE